MSLSREIPLLGTSSSMHAFPHLLAVATAVPRYPLDQNSVIERVKLLFGRSENLDRLLPVFTNTGIRTRYSCVPIEWYDRARQKRDRQHRRRLHDRDRHPEPRCAADRKDGTAAHGAPAADLRARLRR